MATKKKKTIQEQQKENIQSSQPNATNIPQPPMLNTIPTQTPKTTPKGDVINKSAPPEVTRDVNSGQVSGFTDPRTGKTYFGGSPEEIRNVIAEISMQQATPQGAVEGSALAKQKELDLISQQLGLTPQQIAAVQAQATESNIDWGQALGAGTIKNIPSIITNAATYGGGALVASGGNPAAAIAGGVVGGLKSIYSGVVGNIANQQAGELGANTVILRDAQSNMRQLAMLATSDPANADIYIADYNKQLSNVWEAYSKSKLEVTGFVDKSFEDGTETLAEFESFLQPGGISDIYGQKIRVALSTGTQLNPVDFLNEQPI